MDGFLNAVGDLVTTSLQAAGNLAETTADAALDIVGNATGTANAIYQYYLSTGMTPENAADATERTLRDITGRIII